MLRHWHLRIFYLTVLKLFICALASEHPGHLKPFGSSGPFRQITELTNGFPDPVEFFDSYVSKSLPVIFRQAIADDLHLSLWNDDEDVKKVFLNNTDIVHVETRKKESRQQDILTMTMTEFLNRYQHEELYLVAEVPNSLRSYFVVPKCLQCKPAIDTFQVAMFWYSSGNTSSVLHTDDYDNINCILQGEKTFIMIDPHAFKEAASELIDNYSGSYSSMDVDHVDYKKYRSLENKDLYYYDIHLTKGDCLFLPSLWMHQVRSKHRNIAINYWLSHERVKKAIVDRTNCVLSNDTDFFRLDTIRWPKELSNTEELRNYMFDLIDEGHINFRHWTKEFSKDLHFDLRSDVEAITHFAEFFDTVDTDEDGEITTNDIETLFDNDGITTASEILEDILDIIDMKLKTEKTIEVPGAVDHDEL